MAGVRYSEDGKNANAPHLHTQQNHSILLYPTTQDFQCKLTKLFYGYKRQYCISLNPRLNTS